MTAGSTENTMEWQDKKRRLWLMGLVFPTLVLTVTPFIWAMNKLGWYPASQVLFWIGPILLYVVMPTLDLRFGADGQNPPDEAAQLLEEDRYYRFCTYAFVPLQYLSVISAALTFTAPNLAWLGQGPLGWPAKIGLALSIGALGGVGINTAHEMGHKRESLERWLSKISLAPTGYGHFYIEHNRGHHVRVATPEDPSSARFGETFWEFLPRSVFGSLRSALRLEAQRIRRLGGNPWNPNLPDQRRAQRLADDRRAVGSADRGVRPGGDPVPDHPGGLRHHPARGGQLPRALRPAAAEEAKRPLRALHARAQLELRPHRHQRVAVPPAAA
jgi:alkane 1-monooxygenase